MKMRITGKAGLILGLSLALLESGPAGAGDLVTVRLYNDGSDDLVVTVYDLNAAPQGSAHGTQRINGFAWVALSVTRDADGGGHIGWTARSADEFFLRCGRQDIGGLGEDDTVRVFADSSCARTARGY
jgi:hypothetical protein